METIPRFIKFLKSRQSFQERKMRQLIKSHPDAARKHEEAAKNFSEIVQWLEEYGKTPSSTSSASETPSEDLFSLNPLEIGEFPEEFRQELNISQGDEQDAQVIELLKIANRPLDLNELLIGCWRKFNVQHKRNLLTARLYRLAKRNEVHAVGKGTYALGPDPNEAQRDEIEPENLV